MQAHDIAAICNMKVQSDLAMALSALQSKVAGAPWIFQAKHAYD